MAKTNVKNEAAAKGAGPAVEIMRQTDAARLADAETGELTVAGRNQLVKQEEELDFSGDAGMGLENTTKDDYAIPMLIILQGLSPQVVDNTVEGARPGLILNSITEKLSEGVAVVPVAFERRFLQWAPREKGGGFRGQHAPLDVEMGKVGEKFKDSKGVERLGVLVTAPDGGKYYDTLKDTRTHYVLVLHEDGSFNPAVIAMSSTQIKKSKRWLSLINEAKERNPAGALFTPPSFSRMYELSTVKESNDQGTWFGWSVGALGKIRDRELYAAAKAFHAQISAGEVKVRHDDAVEAEPAGAGDSAEARAAAGF